MDYLESPGSLMAWSWVIEALASHGEVELELILDLVELAPKLSDNLNEGAREVIALRKLESLFDPAMASNSGVPLSSDQQEIQFDSSESFNHVLKRIIDLPSVSSLRMNGENPVPNIRKCSFDKLAREVHAYIERKKAIMPKCFLQKLSDAMQNRDAHQKTNLKRERTQSGKLHPKKKPRYDNNGSIAPTEQNSDPFISSNVLNEIKKRNAKNSSTRSVTKLDICIKCKKDGEVLICKGSNCSLVVHERCLGITENIENRDNFLCPQCVYSLAKSEYTEAKERMLVARDKLKLFFGGNHSPTPECPSKQGEGITGNQHEGFLAQDYIVRTSPPICSSREEESVPVNSCQLEKRFILVNFPTPDFDGSTLEENGNNASTDEQDNSHLAPDDVYDLPPICWLKVGEEEAFAASLDDCAEISEDDTSTPSLEDLKVISKKQTSGATTKRKSQRLKSIARTPSTPDQRKRKRKAIIKERVPWTEEEVEMLKEGVKRFGSGDIGYMPWSSILKTGRSVFWEGRTGVNLKDKWRNLVKANPKLR